MKKTAVVIENIRPLLDCGRYAIKRLVGDPVHVIFYRVAGPGLVEIVRLLHERMEPSRYLLD
jgi:plasmid stabilization system protein ParE